MDTTTEKDHEAEVLTEYNPNPEYKQVVGFLGFNARKSRNLDIYKITDYGYTGIDFIGRYERFVDPNFELGRSTDDKPYLLFTILFKRPRPPPLENNKSYTYLWIKPEVPYCLKLRKYTDRYEIEEINPREIIEPELKIKLEDLQLENYIVEYSDYLDNNGPIEVFDEKSNSIVYYHIKDASSMDIAGGKRRKNRRRRTKRRRKSKKARKSRRHRK